MWVTQNSDLRVAPTSISAAGAQFAEGNQLQVKLIFQLSRLLTHV